MTKEQHDAKSAEGTTELPRDYAVTKTTTSTLKELGITFAEDALPKITSVLTQTVLDELNGKLGKEEGADGFVSTLLGRLGSVVTGLEKSNIKPFCTAILDYLASLVTQTLPHSSLASLITAFLPQAEAAIETFLRDELGLNNPEAQDANES